MTSDFDVEVVVHIPTVLGEGPLWSSEEEVLYWIDIFRPTIVALDRRFALRSRDGAMVLEVRGLPESQFRYLPN